MRPLLHAVRKLDRVPILVACGALFALMVMTFFDVILRSTFNAPIEAATELTRIFVAIAVFSVLPHVSVTNYHICVDLTDGLFQRYRLEKLRDGLILIASGVMLFWPTQRVIVLAERTRSYGDVTEYLAIPQFYIMWFIAIATGIAAVSMVVAGLLTLLAPQLLRDDTQ
ncbi:TRAP transporter small permease [Roseovarius salinarum]|uniref:TRAP transporter small permease n=1 Tax=Roseovarius salinarum TaxID=1981892 RepID=UPI000C3245CC|nr:TRAP transporter small permease subunit [Roseovarius salinarum]